MRWKRRLNQVASSHAKQVLDFYRAGPETLWITFSESHLWWAEANGPVEFLGGSQDEMDERGSRLRPEQPQQRDLLLCLLLIPSGAETLAFGAARQDCPLPFVRLDFRHQQNVTVTMQ